MHEQGTLDLKKNIFFYHKRKRTHFNNNSSLTTEFVYQEYSQLAYLSKRYSSMYSVCHLDHRYFFKLAQNLSCTNKFPSSIEQAWPQVACNLELPSKVMCIWRGSHRTHFWTTGISLILVNVLQNRGLVLKLHGWYLCNHSPRQSNARLYIIAEFCQQEVGH